jgi:hypothetical protein
MIVDKIFHEGLDGTQNGRGIGAPA